MEEGGRPAFSILIVSWNCEALLVRCLRSIAEFAGVDHETIVVDNASTDGTRERVGAEFPWVRLFPLPENVGFSCGNNTGLAVARGRRLLLLNPDTEIRPGALESLARFLDGHPKAGLCAPPLWNPDGSPQSAVLRFPTLGNEFLRQTMLHRVFAGAASGGTGTRPVEAVSGAALCIRRECFEAIGPLDPSIFMFYEDVDWCRRARNAGWEIWFVDGPGVLHVKAGSSSGEARTRTLVESLRSTVYYFQKHGKPGDLSRLRAIAALGATVRSLRAATLWLLGRERADQRARLAAYRRMLAWAFADGTL